MYTIFHVIYYNYNDYIYYKQYNFLFCSNKMEMTYRVIIDYSLNTKNSPLVATIDKHHIAHSDSNNDVTNILNHTHAYIWCFIFIFKIVIKLLVNMFCMFDTYRLTLSDVYCWNRVNFITFFSCIWLLFKHVQICFLLLLLCLFWHYSIS